MSNAGKATPIKWSMPHDPEAWPDTGQVMNAQEAAVTFNALIDRLTQLDKLARELAEDIISSHKAYNQPSQSMPMRESDWVEEIDKARQLLKLYEEDK